MCLFIDEHEKMLIADRDIKCWKLIKNIGLFNYLTPYRDYRISILNLLGIKNLKSNNSESNPKLYLGKLSVDIGYIHSFKDYESAIKYYYGYMGCSSIIRVVECIIPKGTQYYEGYVNIPPSKCRYEGYASKELKFIPLTIKRVCKINY